MRKFLSSSCLACGLVLGSLVSGGQGVAQAADACGNISISSASWQSAELLASLDKFILDHGYGCNSEIIIGDSMVLSTTMVEKGTPEIVPEGWFNQIPPIVKQAIERGDLIGAADVFENGAVHGWWIPKYTAEAYPDIKTIDDALKHPELFPGSEDSSRGAVHNGPTSWFATTVTGQLYKAYGGDTAGFTLVDPGSAAGLDGSLIRAYERGEHWLGYYWAPSSILGKYDMVRLGFGVDHDAAEWARCTSVPECADPKRNTWPHDRVLTIITKEFSQRAGADILAYLNSRTWDDGTINTLLAWMTDNQATGDEAAVHFLKNYQTIWTKWVSVQAAEKIKAAL